ncbi:MAG: hypothetical protein BZ151_00055 [Desulfobacca sp. 4484_104]|nr:MAG: hypothetical protein BZ151_00055 [Desulfobacca sp. 4484_104]
MHTITNAIMLLGLERIRDLTIGLRLFENFSCSQNLSPVRRLIISAFFTALLSQALSQDTRRYQGEEVFITGLLFNLGELIAAYYLPEDYDQILQIAARQGISRSRAAKQVLKVSWQELGLAILRKWQFPTGLVMKLSYLHMASDTTTGDDVPLRLLVQNAHELGQSLLEAELSPEEWQHRLQRCGKRLNITSDRLDQIITSSINGIQELTKTLGIDLQELKLPISSIQGSFQTQLDSEVLVPDEDQRTSPDSQSARRVRQSARFGLGPGVEDLLPVLQLPFSPSDNILALALAERREYIFKAGEQRENLKLMPASFWKIIGEADFLVTPILVNEVAIGFFYVDRCGSQCSFSDEDRQRLEIFRNLTTIALRCCCSTPSNFQYKVP